jgi:multiple sugar transport system ATP-binding protein
LYVSIKEESMATVKLENIYKSFGETEVLFDINLEIDDKEFVVFVGPSGCGKTTLLRIISGLEEVTSGKVVIDDKDVSNAPPVERGISMVFQSYALYPHLSVFENIAFPLRVAKLKEKELEEKVFKAADILQLRDRLDFKPGQLSGGQRQRVAIGRSIVRDPKVFLFDEPLSNLDAALRGDMRVELAKLHQNLKTTMIYVTHDQIEAMTMADKIVVLRDGVIEQVGSPMDLYHHPMTKFVAGFIGQPKMNFLKTTNVIVQNKKLTTNVTDSNSVTLVVEVEETKSGDLVEIGIRPEDLEITSDKKGLLMNVEVVEHLGATVILYGSVQEDGDFCAVLPSDVDVKPGQDIRLKLDPAKCHAFKENGQALYRIVGNDLTKEQP